MENYIKNNSSILLT